MPPIPVSEMVHFQFSIYLLQRKILYKEVLYTISHKIGSSRINGNSGLEFGSNFNSKQQQHHQYTMLKEQLQEFAQEAFKIDPEEHQKIMEEAKDEKVSFNHSKTTRICL